MAENTGTSIQENGIPEISMDLSASSVITQPTDKTLLNEGQPADAKAVGDKFADVMDDISDIQAYTASDIAYAGTTSIKDKIDEIADNVENLDERTADDIVYETPAGEEPITIKEKVDGLANEVSGLVDLVFPVGAIYMTTLTSVPEDIGGTWVEIKITSTWDELKNGIHNYTTLLSGETTGTVHFFRRTA